MDTISFEDWEVKQMQDPEFRAAVEALEDEYQTDALRIRGAVKIELRDAETGEVNVWESGNNVVDNGLNLILERLTGVAGMAALGYLALGSGTASFLGSATGLNAEYYRKAITSASCSSNVLTVKTYFTTAQGNDDVIREIGLTNAAASGAGTLIIHLEVSPSQAKTSAKEMVVTNSLTLSRA